MTKAFEGLGCDQLIREREGGIEKKQEKKLEGGRDLLHFDERNVR